MNFQPSEFQTAIFERMADPRGGNLQINAVAGSGKTTTIIEGLNRLPSYLAESVLLCAFNKDIARVLGEKAPESVTVKTNHAIGFATLAKHFAPNGGRWGVSVDDGNQKYRAFIRRYWLSNGFRNADDEETIAEQEMLKLTHFARVCLVDPTDFDRVIDLADAYEVDLPQPDRMLTALPVLLGWGVDGLPTPDERGRTWHPSECIDFDDMVWLPWALNLTPKQFRMVLVDECQDLNAAQLDLILKCVAPKGRFVAVGDPRQAIYAFAGADANAFDNITLRANAQVLPLSVCYRCPTSVIALAQSIVPSIQAAPGAPEGCVETIKNETFLSEVNRNDMVLCRVTADLIEAAFALIRMGKPAKVRGRDIGRSLVRILDDVEKQEGFGFAEFTTYLAQYQDMKTVALRQKKNADSRIQALNDRVESILVVWENVVALGGKSIGELRSYINDLFADDGRGVVMLSTIHRAKGLEAERVFILRPDLLPHPMATTPSSRGQEENLKYVAVTRARRELFIVTPPLKV